VEDLDHLEFRLGGRNERARLYLGDADLQLGLDPQRDVIGKALDLAETVEVRGGICEVASYHVCCSPLTTALA
jgi:hypothetical protein